MLTKRQHWMLVAPLILILVPFLIGPAIFGLFASFTNYAPAHIAIHFVGLENYLRVLNDSPFQSAVRNEAILTLVSVSLELVIGTTIAFALRESFRGRWFVRFLLLAPWLVSPVASGIMWHYISGSGHGLLNYFAALLGLPDLPFPFTVELALPTTILVEVWRKVPFATFLILPGILAIPSETWDEARIEGIPLLAQIRHIVLPRLRVLLLTVTLLLTGEALGVFESILMLTGGGPGTTTLTPGLYSYNRAFVAYDWVGGATSGWFIVGAVIVLGTAYLVLTQREDS